MWKNKINERINECRRIQSQKPTPVTQEDLIDVARAAFFLWSIHRLTWLTMCLTMSLQATSYGSSGYDKLMKKVKIE